MFLSGYISKFAHIDVKKFNEVLTKLMMVQKFFKFVSFDPCKSSPSLTILVPFWFISMSLSFIIFRFPSISVRKLTILEKHDVSTTLCHHCQMNKLEITERHIYRFESEKKLISMKT